MLYRARFLSDLIFFALRDASIIGGFLEKFPFEKMFCDYGPVNYLHWFIETLSKHCYLITQKIKGVMKHSVDRNICTSIRGIVQILKINVNKVIHPWTIVFRESLWCKNFIFRTRLHNCPWNNVHSLERKSPLRTVSNVCIKIQDTTWKTRPSVTFFLDAVDVGHWTISTV